MAPSSFYGVGRERKKKKKERKQNPREGKKEIRNFSSFFPSEGESPGGAPSGWKTPSACKGRVHFTPGASFMASGEPHLREGGCQNQVCDPELARALRPLLAPPCFAPPFNALGVSTICDMDMPNELALQIACLLDVGSLDALAGASTSWRAVSRAKEVEEALVRRWCAAATPEATRLDARSLCRSFERLTLAAAACEDGWDAVLWQAAALGCIHGVLLALERGARLEYSGGRREGTALWCAAKFDQVDPNPNPNPTPTPTPNP